MRISDWSSDVCSSDLERTEDHDVAHARSLAADLDAGRADESLRVWLAEHRKPGGDAVAPGGRQPSRHPGHAGEGPDEEQRVGKLRRSDKSRVGTGCVSTARFGWSHDH